MSQQQTPLKKWMTTALAVVALALVGWYISNRSSVDECLLLPIGEPGTYTKIKAEVGATQCLLLRIGERTRHKTVTNITVKIDVPPGEMPISQDIRVEVDPPGSDIKRALGLD